MGRENENKRVFGDNPVSRPTRQQLNTFEKLTSLKQTGRRIETSMIITTPEAIVREYRRHETASGRTAPQNTGAACAGEPEKEPDTFGAVLRALTIISGAAVIIIAIYIVGWQIIPFVETVRWK